MRRTWTSGDAKLAVFVLACSVIFAFAAGCSYSYSAAQSAAAAEPLGKQASSKENPFKGKEIPVSAEKATFAAGCFWGVEATFRKTPGVVDTAVGYTGGKVDNPTYKQVCSGRTAHAEAVEVIFDPEKTSYEKLLEVFWSCHDPTTPNRQGPDIGHQYRSAIFYHSEEQKNAAEVSKEQLDRSGKLRRPVVTEIVPAATFWRAEEYHQRYLEKRGRASCNL